MSLNMKRTSDDVAKLAYVDANILNATKAPMESILGSACSFTVFIDGPNIKAKNGITGKIDYSGPDAKTVMQNVINAMDLLGGGKLIIREGIYNLNGPLTFTRSRTVIEGCGISTTLNFTAIDGSDGLDFNNLDDVVRFGPTIEHIEIIGGGKSSNTGIGIKYTSGTGNHAPRFHINDIKLSGWAVAGIKLCRNYGGLINNVVVKGCGIGIYETGCNASSIRDCSVEDSNTGIKIEGSNSVIVEGATIEGNLGHGLHLITDVSVSVRGIYFEGNGISDNTLYNDIRIETSCQRIEITGCWHSGGGCVTTIDSISCTGLIVMNNNQIGGGTNTTYLNVHNNAFSVIFIGNKNGGAVTGAYATKTIQFDELGRFNNSVCFNNNKNINWLTPASVENKHYLGVNSSDQLFIHQEIGDCILELPGTEQFIVRDWSSGYVTRFAVRANEILANKPVNATATGAGIRTIPTSGTTQPVLTADGELRIWRDTTNSKTYLIVRIGSVDYKIQLT